MQHLLNQLIKLISELVNKKYNILTIEDNILNGGLGSLVLEYVNSLDE